MDPLDIAPAHDVTFELAAKSIGGGTARIESVGFAADGHLYAEISDSTLNLWSVLVWHWPEVLGGIVALILIGCAIPAARALRRPQVRGAPHCRRCNYLLRDTPAGVECPECGTQPGVRRPVIGRSLRRRLRLPGIVAIAALAAYGALFALGVPRENGLRHAVFWTVPRVTRFASDHNVKWLLQHRRMYRELVEIDPASGAVVRTVRHLGIPGSFRLCIGPDGRTAITTLSRGQLAAIDLASGRVLRSAPRPDGVRQPGNPYSGASWIHAPGWMDSTTVCVQFFDPSQRRHDAYRWDISTGSLTRLVEIPFSDSPTGPARDARLLYLMPSRPSLAFEVPARHSVGFGEPSTLRVRDLADHGRVISELTDTFWCGAKPVFLPEGSSFFIRIWGAGDEDLALYSVTEGALIGRLPAPGFMGTLQDGPSGLAYHAASERLFVATTLPDAVHVRDTRAKRWIARLNFVFDGLPDDFPVVSPDGRWAAIIASDNLLIFDLSVLNETRATPTRP